MYEKELGILWEYLAFMPSRLRSFVLPELHTSRMGIAKTKSHVLFYAYYVLCNIDVQKFKKMYTWSTKDTKTLNGVHATEDRSEQTDSVP